MKLNLLQIKEALDLYFQLDAIIESYYQDEGFDLNREGYHEALNLMRCIMERLRNEFNYDNAIQCIHKWQKIAPTIWSCIKCSEKRLLKEKL